MAPAFKIKMLQIEPENKASGQDVKTQKTIYYR